MDRRRTSRRSTSSSRGWITNGIAADPIAPGDPFYFQISSGFAASVAPGVVSAIQNAVTNVAVNIDIQASDPRVKIINHTGVRPNVGAGGIASFDLEFVGDGVPYRFDLQFVRAGTNVVLGSIPVVIGTPIPGDGYGFEDLVEGEIEVHSDFGDHVATIGIANAAPSFTAGANQTILEDAGAQTILCWATNISPGPAADAAQQVNFLVSNNATSLFSTEPAIDLNGTLTYTPALNAFGVAIVSVQLHDDGGTASSGVDTSATQTFTITVTDVNDAPVAVNDIYSTNEDQQLTVAATGVLGNDLDVEGATLTAVLVSNPSHGRVTLSPDGSFVYAPAANYNGPDSFTYKAHDVTLDSAEATVAITVTAVNDAPVAVNDGYSTNEDASLTVAATGVLSNDTDVENDPLTAILVSGPTHGTVTLSSDGSFVYTPAANFNGSDGFTYKANDSALDSAVAAVTITVNAVNDAPVADNDSYTVDQGQTLVVATPGVLDGDTDVDGDALSAIPVAGSGPANGTLTLTANGSFTYTPNAGFTGSDGFSYTANDGVADSNVATVTITVRAVGDVPTVQFDSAAKKLTIRGSSKDDRIDVTRNLNGEIRVNIGNLSFGPYLDSRVDHVWVYGLQGNDEINIGPVVADVIAYGDAGNDEIETRNLGKSILHGGAGDDQLKGSLFGPNLLVGDEGNDDLKGGQLARNILIGGKGEDHLDGGTGNQNLLIGGVTSHDANDSALMAILGEWSEFTPLETRVRNLTRGGGRNGSFVLVRGTTVLDDVTRDTLEGGLLRDWFFRFDKDQIKTGISLPDIIT